jgi:hypothetical protein
MAACLHKMAKIAIMDLFGNNGKKQQSQSAFFGNQYYRVIFLSCHLCYAEGTLQNQTCYKTRQLEQGWNKVLNNLNLRTSYKEIFKQ